MSRDTKLVARGSTEVARKFPFTEKRIANLPIPRDSQRAYYYDSIVRGFCVSISPTGSKSYLLYRKVQGRPMKYTIGPCCDLSVDDARAKAEELNSDIAKGQNPATVKKRIREEATLQELFETYLEHHSKVHKRTWKDDESMFKLHFLPLQYRRISTINKADVVGLHRRIGANRGPYSANRAIELLSSMFNRAREWGWSGQNPAHGVKAFREKKRERFMDGRELKTFFKSLTQEPNTTVRDFFLVALLTGARRANVQAMMWKEIDWTTGTWTIAAENSKSGEAMTVVLSPPVVQILEARKAESEKEYVFPGKGKSKHLVEPKSAWKRVLERARKIELQDWLKENRGKTAADFRKQQDADSFADLRLHDLRRTLGSWQAAAGASLPIIGKSLGHKSLTATQVYARLNLDPVRASVNTATAAMLAAGEAAGLLGDGDETQEKGKEAKYGN